MNEKPPHYKAIQEAEIAFFKVDAAESITARLKVFLRAYLTALFDDPVVIGALYDAIHKHGHDGYLSMSNAARSELKRLCKLDGN